jgi:Protein of unknown function (DUF2934)
MKSTGAVATRAQGTQPPASKSQAIDEAARTATDSSEQDDDQARIEQLAYQIYEERGRTDGYALDDWLEAEALVRQGGRDAA